MAIVRAFFISDEDLKKETIINGNVDDKLINPTILKVQDIQIQRIIGTDLYNELKTQVIASTVTAANATLLNEYIRPCLKEYVVAEFTVPGVFKIFNRSTSTNNSENASPLTESEMVKMHQKFQTDAEFYADMLKRFLLQNSSTYPLYLNGNTDIDKIRPKRNQYFPGLVLEKTTYRGNYMGGVMPVVSTLAENGAYDDYYWYGE